MWVVVLGVEIYEIIFDEFEFELWKVIFFIDSKVVFGYINNEIKRFYVYVRNCVDSIRCFIYFS